MNFTILCAACFAYSASRRSFYSRQREVERGSHAGLRFHPQPAAVILNQALAQRQPHADARMFGAMQAPEQFEHPRLMLRFDPDAVVGHSESNFRSLAA